jgi:hypothetical protein
VARKKTGKSRPISRRVELSLGKRLLFGTLPALALLGLGELGARACWDPETEQSGDQSTVMAPHPTRLWAPREGPHTAFGGSFRINSDLLRAVPTGGQGPRIITLGDSSIFGHGLEDEWTLHARLQTSLAEAGQTSQVLSGGIPGYSTEQSLRLMAEWGWKQKPSLLVIGNLWSDGARSSVPDREWYERYGSISSRMDRTLMEWSQLWTWMRTTSSEQTETPIKLIFERSPEGERRVPLGEYAQNLDRLLQQAAEHSVSAVFLSPCHEKLLNDPELYTGLQSTGYFGVMNAVASHRGVPIVRGCDVLRLAGIERREVAFVQMDPHRPELGNDPLHPSGNSNSAYASAITMVLIEAGWPTQGLIPRSDVGAFSQSIPLGPEDL